MRKYIKSATTYDKESDEYINHQIDRFYNCINNYNKDITSYLKNIIEDDLEDSIDDISYIIDDINYMKRYAEMIYNNIEKNHVENFI